MEKKENIRKKLNLTQDDMAMILKISRSQWALYELGLRDLSTNAMIRLYQIERSFLSDDVFISKYSQKIEAQKFKKKEFLLDALKENEFRQINCKRIIDHLKNDFEAATKQLHLIDFLSKPTNKKYALHPGALKILEEKAEKTLDKNGPLQLLKLQLKQQQLLQEELLLSSLLKENSSPEL